MTLTEAIEDWVRDAERMNGSPALAVVVTEELFAALVDEQGSGSPTVAGLAVLPAASGSDGDVARREMVEIPGPDRVTVYVGAGTEASAFPVGFDPAMPVVFVPVPPANLDDRTRLEMYNRLRWYGLGPEEALAGA